MDHTADELAVIVERANAQGRIVLVCEHASNTIPERFENLGLSTDQQQAHIAWDPGALALARGLAEHLDAVLIHAGLSRLIYDLNRPPHAAGAMPARSEVYDIPGNAQISPAERLARTNAIYLPFHDRLRHEIARRLALGLDPVLVTIHSFTPVYFGQQRAVEFGVIHDADPRLAQAVVEAAPENLITRLNEPYSAADGVAHTLAVQATPMGIANVMLEVRNDLIADPAAQSAMAERLAPVLARALARISPPQAGQ